MRLILDTTTLTDSPAGLEGWQEAPAPDPKRVQQLGLIASCLGMILAGVLLRGAIVPRGLLPTLLILVLAMPVHEFVHALFTPSFGLSPKTMIGIQKGKGLLMPYVVYDGEQPLWRFLLTGIAPTMLLTLLPVMLVLFAPLGDATRGGLGFLAFFNIAISGGDLALVTWIFSRLNLRSFVRQNGWKLYWKPAA